MQIKSQIKIFISSLILTLIIIRFFLFLSPTANLNIGRYNIHHLYLGAFLIIVSLVFFILDIVNNIVIVLAGFSSALVLDEIVYLIATDGSDKAYLTPISLGGAIILTAIVLIFTVFLYRYNKQKVGE